MARDYLSLSRWPGPGSRQGFIMTAGIGSLHEQDDARSQYGI